MHITVIIAGVVSLALIGCSKDSLPVTASQQSPIVVNPGDGQTGVRLDAGVILNFAKPVDRSVVERDFHLVSEWAMADSLCPFSPDMNHGNMMTAMLDSTQMHHLHQNHSTRGGFRWNNDSTVCTFKPDSMMTPKMQYMIHMGREMVEMMGSRMGEMGMMGGHGIGMMQDDMMFHFVTMDTSGTGGGHGHH